MTGATGEGSLMTGAIGEGSLMTGTAQVRGH